MSAHGQSSASNIVAPRSPFYHGPFGRMFRTLPPFDPPGDIEAEKEQNLIELAARMVESEAETEDGSLDNSTIPAGYTYFGQFVDHDLTFDPVSSLQRQNDPDKLRNFRTPRFDLDSLYGNGPKDSPFLYDKNENEGVLLVGKGADPNEEDLPRNAQETAMLGDPRNDENIIVSQLQLVFIKFHNRVMKDITNNDFAEAQRIVRWSYQWVVIHDFLKRIVGEETLNQVLPQPYTDPSKPNLLFYHWRNQPFMPVEFSVAAYRLGHSMVRSTYVLSDKLRRIREQFGFGSTIPIFLPPAENPGPLDDLRGFRILPRGWTIQWDRFLEIQNNDGSIVPPQQSRRIDSKLAFRLSQIPAGPGGSNPLAALNLRRGWKMGLPSGQDVSRRMGITPIYNPDGHDPLWAYILNEAEQPQFCGGGDGERLGVVGGRIVAEVFLGLLAGDPLSYLNIDPSWRPTFAQQGSNFELRDIVVFAGVPLFDEEGA
jgi:hypothetical protein